MSSSSYFYVVTDPLGVVYATDRKYMLLAWWRRNGEASICLKATRVRCDGDITPIEIESL